MSGSGPRLAAPDPIGIGTPMVEALTSYLTRVAADLGLTVAAFVRAVLPTLMNQRETAGHSTIGELVRVASRANGINGAAERWAKELGLVVGLNLESLTLAGWSTVLSPRRSLRPSLGHCAECLASMASDGTVYEPLAWSVLAVTHCPVHDLPLRLACPICGGTQSILRLHGRPGICGRCQQWLGEGPGAAPDRDAAESSRAVAGLLPVTLSSDAFQSALANGAAQCRAQSRLRQVISKHDHSVWRRGLAQPSLDSVLRLCASGGWDPGAFLRGHVEPGHGATSPSRAVGSSRRIDWRLVRRRIEQATAMPEPPSLAEISRDLGITEKFVRRRLRSETDRLVAARTAVRDKKAGERATAATALVMEITTWLLESGADATRREVERRLPAPFLLRERRLGDVWRGTRDAWRASHSAGEVAA